MPNHFGGMPLAPEMDSFQAEIGSNQRLVTGGDLQDGTVIPDARCDPFSSSRATSDARDEQFFGERQDGSIIYKQLGLRRGEVWDESWHCRRATNTKRQSIQE